MSDVISLENGVPVRYSSTATHLYLDKTVWKRQFREYLERCRRIAFAFRWEEEVFWAYQHGAYKRFVMMHGACPS